MEDGIGSGGLWPSDLLHCDDNNLVIMFLMWLLYVMGLMMVVVMMMITKKTIVMTITFLMLIQWSSVEQHPGCLCPNTKRCWKSRVLKTFEWQTDFQSRPLPRYPESRASFSSGKIKDFKNWKRITILNTSDIASLWVLAILSWRLWTLCCLWGFENMFVIVWNATFGSNHTGLNFSHRTWELCWWTILILLGPWEQGLPFNLLGNPRSNARLKLETQILITLLVGWPSFWPKTIWDFHSISPIGLQKILLSCRTPLK